LTRRIATRYNVAMIDTPTPTSIRLSAADLAALQRLAEADDRTVSGLIRKIITDWLKARQQPKRKASVP
jgi:predicted transcriptional regulator